MVRAGRVAGITEKEMRTEFWKENYKERAHLVGLDTYGKILTLTWQELDAWECNGSLWLRMGTGSRGYGNADSGST